VKSLKSHLYYFSETAWFMGIRTELLYRYCYLVSLDMLLLDVLTFIVMSLNTFLILPDI